jgi:hypothetical protein
MRQQVRNENITYWKVPFIKGSISGIERTPSTSLRAQWLPLPIDVFGLAEKRVNTTGLLIEMPWIGDSRRATGCAIAAAWHNTTIHSERSAAYAAWSIVMSPFDYEDKNDSPSNTLTNTPVTLDPSWLHLLTPTLPPTDPTSPGMTTLETILSHGILPADLWDNTWFEHIVAMIVADGLSRFGSQHVMNMTNPDPRQWHKLSVPSFNRTGMLLSSRRAQDDHRTDAPANSVGGWFVVYVYGFSYYPGNTSDKLSLIPIAAYLLLATLHILYTTLWISISGRHGTSSAWESVTELLLLCQNSPPPSEHSSLNNTAAGVTHLKTYKSVVRIRAVPSEDGLGPAKLHLVLDECSPSGLGSFENSSSHLRNGCTHASTNTIPLDNLSAASSNNSSLPSDILPKTSSSDSLPLGASSNTIAASPSNKASSTTMSNNLSTSDPPARPQKVVHRGGNNCHERVVIDRLYG